MEDRFRVRGMDINGKWHVGFLSFLTVNSAHAKAGAYISNSVGIPLAYQVRPDTVGQCTGLKDKNGKLIFEGDIVNVHYSHWLGNRKRLVVWDAERALFYLSPRKNEYDYQSTLSEDNHSDIFGHEIIGNIYQNPELMEDK